MATLQKKEVELTSVIALQEQVRALHPETGKPVTIVGVDVSRAPPQLIVLHKTFEGIFAEMLYSADLPEPTVHG